MIVYLVFRSIPVLEEKSGSKLDYFSNFFHLYEVQISNKIFYYFFINYYNPTILDQKFMKLYLNIRFLFNFFVKIFEF